MDQTQILNRLEGINNEISLLMLGIKASMPVTAEPPVLPTETIARSLSASFKTLNMAILPPTLNKPPKYVIVDFFTTQGGSWDVGQYPELGVEQWAKDKYQASIAGAGADHHLFGLLKDAQGNTIRSSTVFVAWTPQYAGNEIKGFVKSQTGWFDTPVYGSSAFDYKNGQQGIWAWAPDLSGAEILIGGGMPIQNGGAQHVSFFAVWQAV